MALSDPKNGITLNVGVVSGGQTVNTVAPWAKGEVDLRFITPAQRDATFAKVEAIMAKSFVPGTSAKLEITGEFVPLVETADGKALYEHYAAGLKELGVAETTRCSPAAAPIPALPRRPARRPSARSGRSAGGRIRRTSIWRSTRSSRAPRRWRWPCCGCRSMIPWLLLDTRARCRGGGGELRLKQRGSRDSRSCWASDELMNSRAQRLRGRRLRRLPASEFATRQEAADR